MDGELAQPAGGDRPRPLARVEQLAKAGKTPKIYVKGEVVSLSPLLSGLAYEIEDATGSLWIQSQRRDVALGETLHVQGILRRRNTEVAGLKFSEVYLEERRRVED
ncbi:MAG: hypothetical protein HC824_15685 [Synechococcales cyanobacterium RM1_1_8]|nr:hypothetical protein [Synechococcales cyanobacterium RM1_1_8]